MSEIELAQRLDKIEKMSLLAAKNVFTVDEAALILGRSPKTVRNKLNEIPHYISEVGVRFRRDELEAYQCKVKCTPAMDTFRN